MNTSRERSKLVELRTKTDRQLVELIDRTLDAAASLAPGAGAERACEEVRRLLPFVPRADRRRFETRLAEMLQPAEHAACF